MSTKPNIAESRFGVDGADADASNMTAPLSGQRDTGWTLNQVPPSAVANYLQNKAYRWLKYLSDGALSGNHSVDGTLSTTGAVTTGGSLTVGGQSVAFVDFTYTADSTTDQLLKTAHGRETGDGPVRTSNSGGALPTGLAAATDYYLIKIDADHVRVATSRANALAGTAIDITTNGTGTQTLLHQGGTTRVTDAHVTRDLKVDGTLDAPAFGEIKRLVNAMQFRGNSAWDPDSSSVGQVGTVTLPLFIILPVNPGERLKALSVIAKGNGSATMTVPDLVIYNMVTNVQTGLRPNSYDFGGVPVPASPTSLPIPLTSIRVVPDDGASQVRVAISAQSPIEIRTFVCTIDRPPA